MNVMRKKTQKTPKRQAGWHQPQNRFRRGNHAQHKPRKLKLSEELALIAEIQAASTSLNANLCPNDQLPLYPAADTMFCAGCDFRLTVLPEPAVDPRSNFNRAPVNMPGIRKADW